jgi:hypothetical protein
MTYSRASFSRVAKTVPFGARRSRRFGRHAPQVRLRRFHQDDAFDRVRCPVRPAGDGVCSSSSAHPKPTGRRGAATRLRELGGVGEVSAAAALRNGIGLLLRKAVESVGPRQAQVEEPSGGESAAGAHRCSSECSLPSTSLRYPAQLHARRINRPIRRVEPEGD